VALSLETGVDFLRLFYQQERIDIRAAAQRYLDPAHSVVAIVRGQS
jgi:hypothetical protein